MKNTKIILITLFVLVAIVYGATAVSGHLSDADSGPTITCGTDVLEVSVNDSEESYLAGVTAFDDQDGDLTSAVMIQGLSKFIDEDTVKVTYIVFDSDGNLATASRQLHFTDYTSPRFSITQALRYVSGASVALLDRLQVTDCLDGDITSQVRVSSLSATDQAEVYSVDLQGTNSLGETARITLPILVTSGNAGRPVISLREYLVYLNTGDSFTARSYLQGVESTNNELTVSDVTISGLVDTTTPGTYLVYYRCSDSFGTGTAVLTVIVE